MGLRKEASKARAGWRLMFCHALAAAGCWIVFTGSFAAQEMLAGVVALLLVLGFMRAVEHCYPVDVEFAAKDLVQIWRLPWAMLTDSVQVSRVLFEDLFGVQREPARMRALHWYAGNPSAAKRGQAVLAATYLSATPNSIVLGVDHEQSLMIVHELKPTPASALARSLGAQP